MRHAVAIAALLVACGPAPAPEPPGWPEGFEPARFALSDALERWGVMRARIIDDLLATAPSFEYDDALIDEKGRAVRGKTLDRDRIALRPVDGCVADSAIIHELTHVLLQRLTWSGEGDYSWTWDTDHELAQWWRAADDAAKRWKDATCGTSK